MENLPEMRASDDDRDRVVDVLRESLMAGRLTQEEHAERLEAALMAKTLGELEPITRDLVVPGQEPAPSRAVSRVPIEVPARPENSFESMVGIFGGGERKGRWRVKRRTNVLAIFGGYDLDMTDAVFEGREVVVSTFAMFGGVNITVPDGVEIRYQGNGIFGGYGGESTANPDPGAPVVILKGVAIFGGVGAETASKRRGRDKKKKSHGHGHGLHGH